MLASVDGRHDLFREFSRKAARQRCDSQQPVPRLQALLVLDGFLFEIPSFPQASLVIEEKRIYFIRASVEQISFPLAYLAEAPRTDRNRRQRRTCICQIHQTHGACRAPTLRSLGEPTEARQRQRECIGTMGGHSMCPSIPAAVPVPADDRLLTASGAASNPGFRRAKRLARHREHHSSQSVLQTSIRPCFHLIWSRSS